MATMTNSQPQSTVSGLSGIPRQIAVLAGFIGVVIGNGLAEVVPINGQTSAFISNRLPILITPANYAFSIWGLIWLGLGAFAVWQALPAQRDHTLMNKIAPAFLLTCFLNVFWLVLFHFNQFILSSVVIALLTLTLIWIYLQLGIGKRAVSQAERLCTHVPFSLYLGCLCVATVVCIAYTLYDVGYRPELQTQEIWTVALLVVVTVLGAIFAFRHKEIALVGVYIWAFVAIANGRNVVNPSQIVQTTAMVLATILVIVILMAQLRGAKLGNARPIVTGRRKID